MTSGKEDRWSSRRIYSEGCFLYKRIASIVAKTAGTIEKVYVKEGQSVKASELLIQMTK